MVDSTKQKVSSPQRKMTTRERTQEELEEIAHSESDDSQFDWMEDSESEDENLTAFEDSLIKNKSFSKWMIRLLWQILVLAILLGPGLYEKITQDKIVVLNFRLFFWATLTSFTVGSIFILQYIVAGIFDLVYWITFKLPANHVARSYLEFIFPLQRYFKMFLSTVALYVVWTVNIARECSLSAECGGTNCSATTVTDAIVIIGQRQSCYCPGLCQNLATANFWWVQPAFLGIMLSGAALLVEKILIQIIAGSFHKTAYTDRIKESKYACDVLETLDNARKMSKPSFTYLRQEYRINRESRSKWMSRSEETINTSGNIELVTVIHEDNKDQKGEKKHFKRNKSEFNQSKKPKSNASSWKKQNPDQEFTNHIFLSSSNRAKLLAKKIFEFLIRSRNDGNHRRHIVPQDFLRFWEDEEEGNKAFDYFDDNSNKKISRREMKSRILQIFRERSYLQISMSDTDSAIKSLDFIFLIFFTVLLFILFLLLFQVNVTVMVSASASILLAFTFIFGNSAKTMFESLIFLFVQHPYDTGDRVIITLHGIEETMIVTKLMLTMTHFRKATGAEIYVPNSILAGTPIQNIRRSGDQWDNFEIDIEFMNQTEQQEKFRTLLSNFLKENSNDYHPNYLWIPKSMTIDGTQLKVSISYQQKSNFQDVAKRYARRTKFISYLQSALTEAGVDYGAPVIPIEIRNAHHIDGIGITSASLNHRRSHNVENL